MSEADGRGGVMRQAVQAAAGALAAERAAAEPVQLSMLPLPIGNPRAKHLRHQVDRRREAGRPPGATNIDTRMLREWLLKRGVHPLQQLFVWAQHTPQSLAAELGCSQVEAFSQLRQLWADLTPYLAPRLAPVDDQGRAVVPWLNFTVGGRTLTLEGGVAPWTLRERARLEVLENQPVNDVSRPASHGEPSHDPPK